MPKDFSRTERVAGLIQRKLSELIRLEVKDPRVSKMLSISAVKVSGDLSYAKVYVSFLDEDAKHVKESLAALNKAASFLRSLLSQELQTRTTPQLNFVYDESITYGNRLADLIDKAVNNDENPRSEEK